MATIKYDGMELEEFTTPQVFNPPKRMVVWDNGANIKIGIVAAILPGVGFPVTTIDEDGIIQAFHSHCAEIPEAPKPRLVTNRELSRWLAQGNGEYKEIITDHECCMTYFYYSDRGRDVELPKGIKVRKWADTEWHEPTVDYLGIDDKDYYFNKKYGEV